MDLMEAYKFAPTATKDRRGAKSVESRRLTTTLTDKMDVRPAPEALPETRRDRWFSPHRAPRSERLRMVIAKVIARLTRYEMNKGWRKRVRRPRDQSVFESTVTAVLCDLTHHALMADEGRAVAFSRSNQQLGKADRYKPVAMNKTLPYVVDLLARSQFRYLKTVKGYKCPFGGSMSSHMTPGRELLRLIARYGFDLEDLGESCDQETIVLKRTKTGPWDEGESIGYEDTEQTQIYREQMAVINQWIAQSDVEVDPVVKAVHPEHDPTKRVLRRCFTQGRFDRGGRLFGGFWQQLRKSERKCWITIDSEETAALDFSQMAPRLLYGLSGVIPGNEDAYTLPGFERYRSGVKKLFNAMLFAQAPLTRMPRGIGRDLPPSARIGNVVAAIQRAHGAVAHHFFTGIGHHLQFLESELLVDLLLRLREVGCVALPVHDAVLVQRPMVASVRPVMEEVFIQHTGTPALVVEE